MTSSFFSVSGNTMRFTLCLLIALTLLLIFGGVLSASEKKTCPVPKRFNFNQPMAIKIDESKVTLEPVDGQSAYGKLYLSQDGIQKFLLEQNNNLYFRTGLGKDQTNELLYKNAEIEDEFIDSKKRFHAIISQHTKTGRGIFHVFEENGKWLKQQIENIGTSQLSFAVDNNNVAHVMYLSKSGPGEHELRYGNNRGGMWQVEKVGIEPYVQGCRGFNYRAFLDQEGHFHLSYLHRENRESTTRIVYTTNSSGLVESQIIEESKKDIRTTPHIIADLDGRPHLFYIIEKGEDETRNFELIHASFKNGKWKKTLICSHEYLSTECFCIHLTMDNVVHFSFMIKGYETPFYYGSVKNENFRFDKITRNSAGEGYSYLMFDGDNNPYIICIVSHGDKSLLEYAFLKEDRWVVETIREKGGYTTQHPFMDRQGNVHLLVKDNSPGDLIYITNKSGSWMETTVEPGGYPFLRNPYITIDKGNRIHITSWAQNSGTMRLAIRENDAWSAETIDAEIPKKTKHKIAIDKDGSIHIVYIGKDKNSYHSGGGDLFYAVKKDGRWIYENLDDDGTYHDPSIFVDEKLNVHICYREAGYLRYIKNHKDTWSRQLVDHSSLVKGGSEILADKKGKVHIAYFRENNVYRLDTVMYATNNMGEFETFKVDEKGWDIGGLGIALGKDGTAHIAYSYCPGGCTKVLMYGTNKSGKWQSDTLSLMSFYGDKQISMALDKKGRPNITFKAKRLTLARKEEAGWKLYAFDSTHGYGKNHSLIFGHDGKYHIAHDGKKGLWYSTFYEEALPATRFSK